MICGGHKTEMRIFGFVWSDCRLDLPPVSVVVQKWRSEWMNHKIFFYAGLLDVCLGKDLRCLNVLSG
uniref:Uncharacterized protein n=1 Tax=Oryza brachyantha TaxID=4533 RepID=J3LYW9_ORYBR